MYAPADHVEHEFLNAPHQFADGYAYSKGKMEEAFRSGLLDKPTVKAKDSASGKREDVDLLIHELEIPRAQAEKILTENNGDILKALRNWITA
ncbi:hypothetical protein AcW1_006251 [Taiwanofungus camphoratus]|nr:hypothetical protein AcW2_005008 [Antrodia cinnamomea]KAI0934868.1 hypothetical protein AcV5_006568 [Antrodia cinnamomea]KAI0958069.1 hypothetical protein AcW1_006251 [Antrodia cinnamomea]